MSTAGMRNRALMLATILATGGLGAMPGYSREASGDAVDHSQMDHSQDHGVVQSEDPESHAFGEGSGTSRLPGTEGAMQGLHVMTGDWMLMVHGQVALQYTDASGPRGDEKLYSPSMGMLTAERPTQWGRIQLKSMFSLEPTMSARGYPSLLSTGETAGGAALVDRQHPHDLFMELAARFDWNTRAGTAFVYAGPVGEPALGPSAFMHRRSAANNPDPPVAHHWFDSTHITYGVVTAGISSSRWQLEASAFRGQEPDEERWDIETPRLDSWSVRAVLNPSDFWALQASFGELAQPEALHPGQDERRYTASAHYSARSVAAMLAFSAKDRVPGDTLTAWVGELNWDFRRHHSLFGRIESVNNDELFPDHDDALHERAFRVTRLQLGYARHIPLGRNFSVTLGASGSVYALPGELDAAYGDGPLGYTVFARLNLQR